MEIQDELIPLVGGFKPDETRREPRLWIKELRVYRALAPGESNLLRQITLRPGLNILWARPRARSIPGGRAESGVSGHATGKTTFCRFIRFLLGESTFGNDDQRARLRAAFPDGAVVGEIHIEGTPWLVCRPFRVGAWHVVYRGLGIQSLFLSEEGRTTFDEYRKELTRLFAEPLPVATFATAPTPIEWPHIFQWLTRDQECRFSGLAELRHSSSDSQSPNMVSEDTHFLFRAVLNLIDTAEQSELENNKTLLKRKQDAERQAPLLRFRGESAHDRIRGKIPDFRQDLSGADFLDAVHDEWNSRSRASQQELKLIKEPMPLQAARTRYLEAAGELQTAKTRRQDLEQQQEITEQKLRQLKGELSERGLDNWLKTKVRSQTECGHSLAEAIEWECPLAVGRKLPIENKGGDIPVGPTIAKLEAQKTRDGARLDQAKNAVEESERRSSAARIELTKDTDAYDVVRSALATQQAKESALAEEAKRAHADLIEADSMSTALLELDGQIRKSQQVQSAIREKSNSALSAFSDTFARVSQAVLGKEVQGAMHFTGRKVRPTLTQGIDLTSAALETIKIICFDLAALISGVEGRGSHPLFLVHDGPREADMDADLYQQIFRLIRSLEESFGSNPVSFQYVVTTTEPPPQELQGSPWLIDPILDATSPGGKLLGENF